MRLVTRLSLAPALLAGLAAQGPPAGDHGPKFSVRSNLVFLPTRVQRKNGDTIYGLTADQFAVEDNGVRQTVQVEEEPDTLGLSLAVVVQCGRTAPAEFHKLRGLPAMIDAITGAAPHEVAVISYGEQAYVLGDFSRSSGAMRGALLKLKPCGDYHAAAIDAVEYATGLLRARPRRYRRAILLVGEARDHGSRARLDDVAAELGVTDTVIYTVAFSPTRDEFIDGFRNHPPKAPPAAPAAASETNYTDHPPSFELPPEFLMLVNALRRNTAFELASLSGGEYINFTTQRGFDDALDRISNQIHNYYLLSFALPPGAKPSLHMLKVRVPGHPDAVIQTRRNYWSGILGR